MHPALVPSSFSDFARRLTEAAGLAAAAFYGLGLLRTMGELNSLHLASPTVLAGFDHSDVLMKGVGVLTSHISSLVLIVGSIVVYASRATIGAINRHIETGAMRRNVLLLAALGVLGLLGSRVWEGVAFTLVVIAIAVHSVLTRRLVTRTLMIGVLGLGLLMIGFVGSYLHPPPPMRATVERENEPRETGLLIGKGEEGDWYLATRDGDGGYRLEVIGGSVEAPTSVTVQPANDHRYRTLAAEISDTL